MATQIPLLGSYWTLAGAADPAGVQHCVHDLKTRIELASKAGFRGMGFWHADLEVLRDRHGFATVKRMLDDHGIEHVEVEWLLDWYRTGDRRAVSDRTRALLLEAAEALGAHHIKIGDLENDCAEVPKLTEEFAVLCAEARDRGTQVMFEMLPAQFSKAPSLDQVLAICRGAGAPNGGIMLDNLHCVRTGTGAADLVKKIGPEIPLAIEINDGSLAMPRNFIDSVINKRLLPGDGEFDLTGFLCAMWDQGFNGPIGVEVLNEYMRKWPIDVAAEESFRKTNRVVSEARAHWEANRSAHAG